MILRDILNELQLRAPSALAERDWIVFINAAIRRYGRDIAIENYYRFNLNKGEQSYPLPSDVSGGVKAVSVNGSPVKIILYGDSVTDDCCVISPTGYITFSRVPQGQEKAILLYAAARQFMTYEDVVQDYPDRTDRERQEIYDGQRCGVYEDYTDAIIYGAMAEYADAMEDTAKADNYRQEAEAMVSDAKQSKYEKRGKYPTTKAVDIKWKRRLL